MGSRGDGGGRDDDDPRATRTYLLARHECATRSAEAGDWVGALEGWQACLVTTRLVANRQAELAILDRLGGAHAAMGQHLAAVECYANAAVGRWAAGDGVGPSCDSSISAVAHHVLLAAAKDEAGGGNVSVIPPTWTPERTRTLAQCLSGICAASGHHSPSADDARQECTSRPIQGASICAIDLLARRLREAAPMMAADEVARTEAEGAARCSRDDSASPPPGETASSMAARSQAQQRQHRGQQLISAAYVPARDGRMVSQLSTRQMAVPGPVLERTPSEGVPPVSVAASGRASASGVGDFNEDK